MSTDISPSPGFTVVIAPTPADLKRYARLVTRRPKLALYGLTVLLVVATTLALSDGDANALLAALITGVLAIHMLLSAAFVTHRTAQRLPGTLREARSCEVDEQQIQLRGATWSSQYSWANFRSARLTKHFIVLNREPGAPSLVLPRSSFSGPYEPRLIAILAERSLLTAPAARK